MGIKKSFNALIKKDVVQRVSSGKMLCIRHPTGNQISTVLRNINQVIT